MKPPQSALPSSKAFSGMDVILKIKGRKFLNSPEFTERFELEITSINDPVSISGCIDDALNACQYDTEIPADLISGVSFQFVKKSQ